MVNKKIVWKMVVIVAVVVFCMIMAYPPKDKINLGLDLKGGMQLTIEVQTDDAIRIQTDQTVNQIKNIFNDSSIKFANINRKGNNEIEISGTKFEEERRIKDILEDDFRDWNITYTGTRISMKLRPNIEKQFRDQSVDQARETIDNRVDEYGVSSPVIQRQGLSGNRILIELPGIDDPGRVKNLIKSEAMLEYRQAMKGPFTTKQEALKEYNNELPDDLEIVKNSPRMREEGYYVLKKAVVVSGKDLKNARSTTDEYGLPAVGFTFNSQGARKFERFTAANIGKLLAIVLDNRVQVVATIRDAIGFAGGQITGSFKTEEVKDIVIILKSGALPAPIKYLEERSIGPSLGADSVRSGIRAAILGLILVVIFMMFYYRGAGFNSTLALILNLLIIMGIMANFKFTLTLPGIAAIILTIGMSVDANVLIFERIKEDLLAGKSPKSAIESGFKKAFVTIFDANVTTIIAAIFLWQFGTSAIKGFAVTLIIGIIASMFTAVFVSHVIFDLIYGKKKKVTKISI